MDVGRSGLQAVRAHAQAPAPSVETEPAWYWISVLSVVSRSGEAGDTFEVLVAGRHGGGAYFLAKSVVTVSICDFDALSQFLNAFEISRFLARIFELCEFGYQFGTTYYLAWFC